MAEYDPGCYERYSSNCEKRVVTSSWREWYEPVPGKELIIWPDFGGCVKTQADYRRLQALGFTRIVVATYELEQAQQMGIPDANIVLNIGELTKNPEDLAEWLWKNKIAERHFYFMYYDEPHQQRLESDNAENERMKRIARLVHEYNGILIIGEFRSGRLDEYAAYSDGLAFTGYYGHFLWEETEDQTAQWDDFRSDYGGKAWFPWVKMDRKHTNAPINELVEVDHSLFGDGFVDVSDVDYLDDYLDKARQFNMVGAFTPAIRYEMIGRLLEWCHSGSDHSSYVFPWMDTLLSYDRYRDAVITCICNRTFLTSEFHYSLSDKELLLRKIITQLGSCTEQNAVLINEIVCYEYWNRLAMWADAAVRQGWLVRKREEIPEVKVYYCQFGDCDRCEGKEIGETIPNSQRTYWGTTPLRMCNIPRDPREDTSFPTTTFYDDVFFKKY